MKTNRIQIIAVTLLLAISCMLGGCATLAVTPRQQMKETAGRQPVTLGIQVTGERLREALGDTRKSATIEASSKLFDKVILLPMDTRNKSASAIKSEFGTDYILTSTILDHSVSGNINAYWFAAIPLLFFKPYAPIITFEANVSIESSLLDANTGEVLLQQNTTATATDHFSPIKPQDKVHSLSGLCINNVFISLLSEAQQKIASRK